MDATREYIKKIRSQELLEDHFNEQKRLAEVALQSLCKSGFGNMPANDIADHAWQIAKEFTEKGSEYYEGLRKAD